MLLNLVTILCVTPALAMAGNLDNGSRTGDDSAKRGAETSMSSAMGETWMRRALELAERGRGHVEPNPLVGAVLVRGDRIVGEGWHEKFGQAHAEINAPGAGRRIGPRRDAVRDAEPCCHHGKTPPCTDALIHAGIAGVVAALEDPFPQVAGQGAARLRAPASRSSSAFAPRKHAARTLRI